MAKYFTPAWLDGVSGKVDNVVFAKKDRILPVRGIPANGYMREFTYAFAAGAQPTNIKAGFGIIAAAWVAMSGSEQLTWNDQASLESQTLGYDVTGRMMFFSYYMTKLTHGLSTFFYPATLGAGTTNNYADRATRQFTSAV